MKVCVLNASPKGDYSVTLQTVNYIKKHFPEDTFEVLNIARKIRYYEQPEHLAEAANSIAECELVLFSYPVYTFIAPAQLHRFIELVKRSQYADCLTEKPGVQITTSKHFYDITAHNYVNENCADLGMKTLKGLSADMDDLLTDKGRAEALAFWKYVHFTYDNDTFELPSPRCSVQPPEYTANIKNAISAKSNRYEAVILTNCSEGDSSLKAMIMDFRKQFPYKTRVVNINDFDFSGGCLGCFSCASSGKCIYKDGFESFLRDRIQSADAIVYALKISDHCFGARFKMYNDRQFCNGHRTVTMGMPTGYIISGNYEAEHNLRIIVEGRCEVGGNYLSGIATDEYNTFDRLCVLSKRLSYALENSLTQPANFYGVGGMKIFRDLIYVMRGLMKEDHRFYKEHGFYDDLPHKGFVRMAEMQLVGKLMKLPGASKAGIKMTDGMLMPYKYVIEKK